jgi:5-methylcytosine-specific restriction endonuclease McrA
MSFRNGTGGEDLWPKCLAAGVAVISYTGMDFDLSKFPVGEPKKRWQQLSSSQNNSLKTFAYIIKEKDVIYVKRGPNIVGKGVVLRRYKYDGRSKIKDKDGGRWPHSIEVKWTSYSPAVRILLGSTQLPTVRPLPPGEVTRLNNAQQKVSKPEPRRIDLEAREGQILTRQARFRRRNLGLIEAIKRESDYRCQVCGFKFDELYGEIGKEFIIAHHIEPLGSKKGTSRTTFESIALLCANCHAMIHAEAPPLRPEELRKRLKDH